MRVALLKLDADGGIVPDQIARLISRSRKSSCPARALSRSYSAIGAGGHREGAARDLRRSPATNASRFALGAVAAREYLLTGQIPKLVAARHGYAAAEADKAAQLGFESVWSRQADGLAQPRRIRDKAAAIQQVCARSSRMSLARIAPASRECASRLGEIARHAAATMTDSKPSCRQPCPPWQLA